MSKNSVCNVCIQKSSFKLPLSAENCDAWKKNRRWEFWDKVIIHKSRGEVSLVEHDTIEYVSTAYLETPPHPYKKQKQKKEQTNNC